MRGGFLRSLQKDFPPRSGSPASLWSPSGSNPRPFPEAAACKACLAALPRTHCPWQLHRAGPKAQIMQPPGPANQARLGGDSHQIKGPPPPPAPGDSCSTSSASTQPLFSPRRVRFLTRCRDGQKHDPEWGGGEEKGVRHEGSVWEDGVQCGGLCLGPLESCHKSLLIRKGVIGAVERQSACFSALMSHS